MDRIAKALCAADDNALAIDALSREIRRMAPIYIEGEAEDGMTSFGTLRAARPSIVLATFDGGYGELYFDGELIAEGPPPLVAQITGTGRLELCDNWKFARLVAFGAEKLT